MNNDNIKYQFDLIARQYDSHRRCFIPCFDDFYINSLSIIKELKHQAEHISDLGAGTGLLTKEMYLLYTTASFTLIDLSSDMLSIAKQRFKGLDYFEYKTLDYIHNIPQKSDIICSALSIHHLEDNKKLVLFKNIFNSLPKGGCFVNLDQFCSKSASINNMYNSWWINYIDNSGITTLQKEAWLKRKQLDRETSVKDELKMLKDVGFNSIDCIYSFMKFSTIIAIK